MRRRLLVVLIALVGSAFGGCGTIPRGEYRAGVFIHTAPAYSFQIPDGWRAATASDYASFGFNQRVLGKLNEQGRQQFLALGARDVDAREAVLISSRGAWIQVDSGVNRGVRYRSAYTLNEQEKQGIWKTVSALLVNSAPPTDKPKVTFESADVVDYGPNTVLRLRYRSEVQRGSMLWTIIAFYGPSHVVTVGHAGVPEDPSEGVAGLEVIGRSFRFE